MIRVEMWLWPSGYQTGARVLCTVDIGNLLTGTLKRGDYVVRLRDRRGRIFRTAYVKGYPRKQLPAWRLLQAAMKALGEPGTASSGR